jgi:hypothetical protein
METVKIVFDIDSKDVKTTTEELKALNKVTNEEVKALDNLSTAAEDAGDGFVSLRTQVKQAKEEAQKAADKYGEFSKEANAARIKAGQLADQMGDLNRQVNLLNPEAKAKAFSNLAQGVVGAFAVATGALQAFGVKNKEVEELAMKLQGALNITQGIASFGALKESLQDVKVVLGFTTSAQEALTVATEAEAVATTEATVAQKGFTASLLSNPIFLTVAAIGALVGAYILLNKETDAAILNEEDLKKLRDENKTLIDAEKKATIDLAVAREDISKQEGERQKIEAQRVKDLSDRVQKEQDLFSSQLESDSKIKKSIKDIADLRKWASEEKNLELKKDLQSSIFAAESELKAEQAKNKQIRSQRNTLNEGIRAVNKQAVAETEIQNIEEAKDNKAKNEKIAADNKAKREKEKAERERAEKERQQEFDRQMAELEAEAKIQADIIQEKNKERIAIEKKLQDELNRARLLLVKGDKIAELQVQMDILDEKYAQDIYYAEVTGKDTSAIKAQYANDQIAISQQITEAAKEEGDKQLKNKKEQTDKELKLEEEAAAERKAIIAGALQVAAFAGQALLEASNRQSEEELATLEDQKNKKIINEKEYQRRLKEIKNKQAQDAKKQAIYQASLDFSAALINALTFKPAQAVPAALIFASVLAAANLAKIIATPVPKFQKGTLSVPGIDMGRDSVHAILQPGEAVIPTKTNKAYHPAIRAIYEKKISPSEINNFVMSRTSSGGSSSIKASVDTYALTRALSKNKTVEVGNANIIGRAMAKELLRGQNLRRS